MSSNDPAIRQLQLTTQYIALAVGFPVLLAGMVGNVLNMLVFFSLGTYKTNPSSFFMLAKSFFDMTSLLFGLVGHLLIQGFRTSALTSKAWCQVRIPTLYASSLASYTCLCLLSIDSFLYTSRHGHLRQKSTIQRARWVLLGFVCLWICNESPYYFMEPSPVVPNWRCQTTNTLYAQYRSYFTILTLSVIVPLLVVSIFGYLSYRNMRQFNGDRRQLPSNLNRQMLRMTLFAISAVVIFQIPYTIAQIYFTSTANVVKDVYRQTQEQLAKFFFFIYTYNTSATSFYSYCIGSKQFRRQIRQVLSRQRNQVLPYSEARITLTKRQTTGM